MSDILLAFLIGVFVGFVLGGFLMAFDFRVKSGRRW